MIYVDVSAAVHSRAGLGRYAASLARTLAEIAPGRISLFHNQGRGAGLPPALDHLPARGVQIGYKPWRLAVYLGQRARLRFNRLVPGAELFHATEHLLPPLGDLPTVLTVHDLIFRLFPDYHKRLNYWYLNLAMPLFCRRAGAIITVSQASKQDLIHHYGVDPARVHVVHEAADPVFRPPPTAQLEIVRRRYGLPDQYLLHLGTIEPRKNLEGLLQALPLVRQAYPACHLVLAGARGWLDAGFFRRLADSGLDPFVHALGWVPDADLPAVIAAAILAVQPSFYEGFGLPLLEHMACGQVVAASGRSSLPEVGGEAAAYFDPEQPAEMAAVITRLLGDEAERAERRRLGLERAIHFSWQRAARETMAVYDSLLNP